MFGKQIYIKRRNALKQKMHSGIILFLGNTESPMNYNDNTFHFRQDSNFLYFFGLDCPMIAGVIDIENGEEILFGDESTMDDLIWTGKQKTLSEKASRVGVQKTFPFIKLYSFIQQAIAKKRKIHYTPPYRGENKIILANFLSKSVEQLSENASIELIKAIVSLRSVKENEEIQELLLAANTGYKMHIKAMEMAHPGEWEQNIAGTIEGISIAEGGLPSFPVILSQHGETMHNHSHLNFLEKGKLMLVDAGAESTMHYASDNTRTTPVGGEFTQQQKDIYDIVLEANNRTREMAKPGITYLSVHLGACETIVSGLKDLGLMKGDVKEAVKQGAWALFMPHGIGHMMGLDVHDMEDLGQNYVGYDDEVSPIDKFGFSSIRMGRRLQKGFVVTDEPGIYFIPALAEKWKSEKINNEFINFSTFEKYCNFGGIRIEDDLLITDNGNTIIGKRIPVTPDEIYNTVNEKIK